MAIDPASPPRRPLVIGILVYLLTILSMATVGAVVTTMMRFCADIHATPVELGVAISMFSLPSATLGIFGGLINRFGHRRTIIISGLVAAMNDVLIYLSGSLLALDLGLLLTGLAFTGASIASPAYLMNMLDGADRARAVSLWSTYGPTGYAIGLLLAAPFTTGDNWRMPLLIAGALLAVFSVAAAFILPRDAPATSTEALSGREQVRDVIHMLGDRHFVRLAFALGVPTAISYGTGIAAPSYISTTYGVSIGSSAAMVAAAKIAAMIMGGVMIGQLLARNMSIHRLFGITALLGIVAQIMLFAPFFGVGVAFTALIMWLFAVSGISATTMMMVPAVNPDPSKRALAVGLIGQVMSLLCFVAPPLYLSLHWWGSFILIAVTGLLFGFAILPRPKSTIPAFPVIVKSRLS
ncbi:MAG TPA: MFS transporter [Sphingomonas sp.]|nr:MFS transporter [Sphingomonas sp.]